MCTGPAAHRDQSPTSSSVAGREYWMNFFDLFQYLHWFDQIGEPVVGRVSHGMKTHEKLLQPHFLSDICLMLLLKMIYKGWDPAAIAHKMMPAINARTYSLSDRTPKPPFSLGRVMVLSFTMWRVWSMSPAHRKWMMTFSISSNSFSFPAQRVRKYHNDP